MIAFCNKVTSSVDEGRAADVVYLDFSKAFKTISPKSLTDKLMKYKLDKWTVRWTENWLNRQVQRVLMSDTKTSWKPGTSGVAQWPILLNNSIKDLGNRSECNFSNMADNLNCEEWLIYQMAGLQFRVTSGVWRNGLSGSQSSLSGKQLCRKGPGDPSEKQVEHEPAMSLCT
ncbi:mitochondrial enolase superfamily member 1 [Grus japonensis]|uniref:Mitochondrial enolase superfamily member 1 n=1 Tax=Grus japonensis TaxID=30415 RepID=A0ABC9WRV4_GRUJA